MVTKCMEVIFIARNSYKFLRQNMLINSLNFRAKTERKKQRILQIKGLTYRKVVLPFHLAPSEPYKLPPYIATDKKESRFIPKSIRT